MDSTTISYLSLQKKSLINLTFQLLYICSICPSVIDFKTNALSFLLALLICSSWPNSPYSLFSLLTFFGSTCLPFFSWLHFSVVSVVSMCSKIIATKKRGNIYLPEKKTGKISKPAREENMWQRKGGAFGQKIIRTFGPKSGKNIWPKKW